MNKSKVLFRYRSLCGYCSTKGTVDWREIEIKRDADGKIIIECLNCHGITDFVALATGNPFKILQRRQMNAR